MKTSLVNLKNGGKLLFNRQKDVNGIVIKFCFKAGALNDPIGKLGVAHFCEHAFCGFANAKMTREERRAYSKNFQYFNAWTGEKFLTFIIHTVESDFEKAIDFMTESFSSILWLDQDYEIERKIIEDEIKTRRQLNSYLTPFVSNVKMLDEQAYNNMDDGPAGSIESFSKITLDDLKEFTKNYLTLNNLTALICGNIKKGKAISIIKKYTEERLPLQGLDGYDKKFIDFKEPSVNFVKAIEEGKARIEVAYDLGLLQADMKNLGKLKMLRGVLNEKTFDYFRTELKLCYSCNNFLNRAFGHLINEVIIDCQEENIGKVIEKYGDFIKSLPKDLPRELFEKHKERIGKSYNFDFDCLSVITQNMINVYEKYNILYCDNYNKSVRNIISNTSYEEVNELYKSLYLTKPYIILVASEKFKDFDYKDIVTTKN